MEGDSANGGQGGRCGYGWVVRGGGGECSGIGRQGTPISWSCGEQAFTRLPVSYGFSNNEPQLFLDVENNQQQLDGLPTCDNLASSKNAQFCSSLYHHHRVSPHLWGLHFSFVVDQGLLSTSNMVHIITRGCTCQLIICFGTC